MKKTITLMAMFLMIAFCSEATLTLPRPVGNSFELPKKESVEVGARLKIASPQQAPTRNIEEDDADLYAYRIVASIGELHGWFNFTAKYPSNFNLVKSFGNAAGDYGIAAATNAKGTTYAYIFQHYGSNSTGWNDIQMPIGIGVLDHSTGEYEIKYTTDTFHLFQYNQLFYDMAYDPVTDKIYACEFAYTETGEYTGQMNIYTIDPDTCEPTLIGKADSVFVAMAADNGRVYGLTQNYDEESQMAVTSLVKFDPTKSENGVFKTELAANIFGGENIAYAVQTMEFDLTTHKLYWLGYRAYSETNIKGFIAEINTKNGKLINETEIPYNAQYLGLTIPYQLVSDNAPAAVTNLAVTAAPNGANEATLTWKNPTKTYQLENLSELTGVKIYRDNQLIETIATTEVGASMSFTDTNVESALHTYKLVPYNTAGDGIYREYTEFVGTDVPSFVNNINYTTNVDEVTITWGAPTASLNGGWFNADELKYNVYRGTYKIATDITETTITDKVNEYKAYEYTIEPSTSAGKGTSTSIRIAFGPAVELPYENQMETDDRAYELMVIDNDRNGITWEYSDGYQGYVYSTTMAGGQVGDDYLVLPHMELTKGKKYQVRFYYYTGNYGADMYEKLQLLVGKSQKPEDLKTVVKEFNFLADYAHGGQWYEVYTEYLATEDGLFNFAFKCTTDEEIGFIVLSWLEVREVGALEAEAYGVSGQVETYVGTEAEYTVNVRNIGSSDIPSATVKLLNYDGKVLSELPIENLLVDEHRDVKITWTPEAEGSYKIYGVIRVADGQDLYDWDDVTGSYVNVTVNAAGSDNWIVVGKDNPDTYDDRVIALGNVYSLSQWFYYPDEIGKDVEITGIRLHYSSSVDAESLTEVPLVVRMANTDRDALIDGGYNKGDDFEPSENLTVVFDDVVDISGTDEVSNILEIKFDAPFAYDSSKNLLIEFDKEWEDKYTGVKWHMDINPKYADRYSQHTDYWGNPIPCGRGGFFNSNSPHSKELWNTATDYFPHIKFSYKNDLSVDKLDVESNVVITVVDGTILFNKICESVELYGIAGNKVGSAKNTNSLVVDYLPAGIYVVKVVAEGEISTKKVMIK